MKPAVSPELSSHATIDLAAIVAEAKTGPVQRSDLNSQVYAILINWIVTRKLKAHQKLSISEIAEKLGVSRSPVHQALTRLVSENFVTVSPRQGYYVTPITTETVVKAFDVRLALELMAAERSVGQVAPEQLAELRRRMEATLRMVSGDEIRDKAGYLATNWALHRYQVALADNPLMTHYYENLKVHLLMGRVINARGAGMRHIVKEHQELVASYEACDLARAQAAIRQHILSGKRVAVEEIAAAGGNV
jgi:DNA-binding GntR family transcriptional regulator